jgi:hypothetical protein
MRVPQQGEKVTVLGQSGFFTVLRVNEKRRTVDVRRIGDPRDHELYGIPWMDLGYPGEHADHENELCSNTDCGHAKKYHIGGHCNGVKDLKRRVTVPEENANRVRAVGESRLCACTKFVAP